MKRQAKKTEDRGVIIKGHSLFDEEPFEALIKSIYQINTFDRNIK